jgi:aryl-alcohol dehydrogenase
MERILRRSLMEALAAVSHETGKMGIEKIDVAEPKTGEIAVKMVACGVCHTDAAGLHQIFPVPFPAVYGHEGVGIVDKVGDNVTNVAVGDRVVMTFPSCGVCPSCVDGHPYACDRMLELFWGGRLPDGTTPYSQDGVPVSTFFGQGSFSTYTVVQARNVVKVDIDSDEELANLCSLGCGVQTGVGAVLHGLKAEPHGSIAVFGAGGVGMAAIMGAKLAGCYPIIAVDVVPSRLELAKEIGATHTVNGKEVDAVEEIRKITNGGAHYSVESSAVPALTLQALDCLRKRGKACQVSVTGPATIELPIEPLILSKNVTYFGLAEGASNPPVFIPELVAYYKQGRLPVDKLVTLYDFKDIDKAFEDSHTGVAIKPILVF